MRPDPADVLELRTCAARVLDRLDCLDEAARSAPAARRARALATRAVELADGLPVGMCPAELLAVLRDAEAALA